MTDESNRFRFLQVSDVFLDASLTGHALFLPAGKRRELNNQALDSLLTVVDMVREKKADALIIPGNLWDAGNVSTNTLSRVIEAFAQLGDVPVVIAPGASDSFAEDCIYTNKTLAAHGLRPWSNNVFVFKSEHQFEILKHPQRIDVTFIGKSCQRPDSKTFRPLKNQMPRLPERRINIGVFQGTYDEMPEKAHGLAPFSLGELEAQQLNYVAVGGAANSLELRNDHEHLLGAYAGTLVGRERVELGERHVIYGELTPFPSGRLALDIERVPLPGRRLLCVTCSINGINPANIKTAVRRAIEGGGARLGDIVLLRLTGTYPQGAKIEFVDQQMREDYTLALENRTRQDYLLQKTDEKSTEGKFLAVLQDLKRKAEAKGGVLPDTEYGALRARTIEDALYYGLDALKRKTVAVRDAD